MSGCSGNRAVAVSMRELSLGLVSANEVLRVWLKEVDVGVINGVALGLLIATVAFLWKGNSWLGTVVGIAMMLNTIIAVSLGGTLPLIMRRLNLDPRTGFRPHPHHRHRHVRFLPRSQPRQPLAAVADLIQG